MIVALDKLTGKEIWRTEDAGLGGSGKDGAGYSSIVISNACGVKQYVQLVGRASSACGPATASSCGATTDVANRTANIPTPLISGDYVFCSTGYGTGSALLKLVKDGDGIKCEEQYFLPGDKAQNHHGQMILKDGYVYFGHRHSSGFPICVELATGKIVWGGSERGPGNGSAAICYADGHLVFRYQSGEVALIEATPSRLPSQRLLQARLRRQRPLLGAARRHRRPAVSARPGQADVLRRAGQVSHESQLGSERVGRTANRTPGKSKPTASCSSSSSYS